MRKPRLMSSPSPIAETLAIAPMTLRIPEWWVRGRLVHPPETLQRTRSQRSDGRSGLRCHLFLPHFRRRTPDTRSYECAM